MKPIKLTIQAFQSYLDKTEIDFTKLGDKGLFLVDGETGAGKSTIFQAIYYALYKEFLNSGGKGCVDIVDKDIRNINAPDKMKTIVDLIFEEKGNYYHVNRTINKKGSTESHLFDVLSLDPYEEKPEQLESGGKALNKRIKDIIGLDADQFEKTILIPQGKFEDLLNQDTKGRRDIYRSLFGTDSYNKFQARLSDLANKAQTDLKSESAKVNIQYNNIKVDEEDLDLVEEKKSIFNSPDIKQDEAYAFIEKITDKYKKDLNESKSLMDEEQKELQILSGNEQKAKDYINNKEKLKNIKIQIDSLNPKLQVSSKNLTELESKDKEIELDNKNLIDLKNNLVDLDNLASKEKEKKNYESSICFQKNQSKKKQDELAIVLKQLEDTNNELKNLTPDPTEELIKIDEESKPLFQKEKELEQIKEDIAKLTANKDNLIKLVDKANLLRHKKEILEQEKDKMIKIRFNNYAGYLAEELKENCPCPVCGSISHPNPTRLSTNSVSDEEMKKIEDEYNAKANESSYADSKVDSEQKQIMELTETISSKLKKYDSDFKSIDLSYQKVNDKLSKEIKDFESRKMSLLSKQCYKTSLETNRDTSNLKKDKLNSEISRIESDLASSEAHILENIKYIEELKNKIGNKSREDVEKNIVYLKKKISNYKVLLNKTRNDVNQITTEITNLKGQEKILSNSITEYESQLNLSLEEIISKKNQIQNDFNINNSKYSKYSSFYSTNESILSQLKSEFPIIEKLQKQATNLNHLNLVFGGGNCDGVKETIEVYVQGKQLERVLHFANKRLLEMTNNHFSMVKANAGEYGAKALSGLEINIRDNQNLAPDGKTRKSITLSGGESFKAALSLALGLRDTVALTKEGINIDCMYIDEGFGTLDKNSLDDIMSVLSNQTVEQGNCLVGIISHVDLLQTRIKKKIEVSKDSSGNSHAVIKIEE